MSKVSRKDLAISLRKEGYSYSYIHNVTGLSLSTLSYHLAKITYKPNKKTQLMLKKAQIASAETKYKQKQQKLSIAKQEAEVLLGNVLNNRDILIAGIALYAGEGSKTNNLVRLVNANPKIIIFFIRWLEVLGVPKSHLAIRIHAYPESNLVDCLKYWQEQTSLSSKQFQKTCIDIRTGKSRKKSAVHKFGTAHVTVKANGKPEFGTALSRKIDALMEILLR